MQIRAEIKYSRLCRRHPHTHIFSDTHTHTHRGTGCDREIESLCYTMYLLFFFCFFSRCSFMHVLVSLRVMNEKNR